MVFGLLGYWGMLNVGGIILQLVGFIWLLSEFHGWLNRVGQKIGDTDKEIHATIKLVKISGVYFIIAGTTLELISVICGAYYPNFLSKLSWPF